MAISCSYNEKVKVSLQVIYCQTSFFGLSGIIVTLVPDINIQYQQENQHVDLHQHEHTLCHKSSFNPCCNVHGFFLVKTSYVSLIYKCRIVLKIFTDPFLSYTTLQRGEISNFINRQTKSA